MMPATEGLMANRHSKWARALVTRSGQVALAAGLVLGATACQEDELQVIKPPANQIDIFSQKQAAQVDILWVVDNSGSMAAEQTKLSGAFVDFFNQLIRSKVDYHIGVVTTDPAEDGALRAYNGAAVPGCDGCRYLTSAVSCTDPNVSIAGLTSEAEIEARLMSSCQAQLVFRRMIQAGTDGSAFEEGFRQAARSLGLNSVDPVTGFPNGTPPASNVGFVRREASMYLIFVSDEDEGAKAEGAPIKYYQRLFESVKGAGNENTVSVSAITGWPVTGAPRLSGTCDVMAAIGYDCANAVMHQDGPALCEALNGGFGRGCLDANAVAGDENAFAETGSRYVELACRTGGVVTNMCDASYTASLDSLGANAAGLLRKFVISKPALASRGRDCTFFTDDDKALDCDQNENTGDDIDGPICVKATPMGGDQAVLVPMDPVSGWVFEPGTNAIRFNGSFLPAPGTNVEITYGLSTQECAQ